jgi:hypothetical protein
MNALVVVIRAAEPESWAGVSGYKAPAQHSAGAAEQNIWGATGAIFENGVVAHIRERLGIMRTGCARQNLGQSLPTKFIRSISALRNRIPGSLPSVHLLQEHPGGKAPIFHFRFLPAVRLHLHLNTGARAWVTRDGSNPTRNGAMT